MGPQPFGVGWLVGQRASKMIGFGTLLGSMATAVEVNAVAVRIGVPDGLAGNARIGIIRQAVAVVIDAVTNFRSAWVDISAGGRIVVAIIIVGNVSDGLVAGQLRNSGIAISVAVRVGVPGRPAGNAGRA